MIARDGFLASQVRHSADPKKRVLPIVVADMYTYIHGIVPIKKKQKCTRFYGLTAWGSHGVAAGSYRERSHTGSSSREARPGREGGGGRQCTQDSSVTR